MHPFELRRVELLHSPSTDEARQWFILSFKVCDVRVSKFFSSCPLVAHFPSEFFYGPAIGFEKWWELGWPICSEQSSGHRLSIWSCFCHPPVEIQRRRIGEISLVDR